MPRVPQYTSQVSAQGSTARQQISTPASAFGAQEAQGVAQIGQGLDRLRQRAVRIQEEDDAASALEAYNQATGRLRDFTHGENGFLNRQGIDAYEGLQDGITEVDRIRSEAAATLNPRQRQAFDNLWRARSESTLNSISTHAANQRRAYQNEQRQAVANDAILTASEEWTNPGEIVRLQGNAALAITAAMQGQPTEAVNAAIEAMQSASWMAAIKGAQAAGDYESASSIFEANRESLVGQDLTRARGMIEEGNLRTRTQRIADSVWDRFGSDTRAGLANIRQNHEGQDRDEAERRYLNTARVHREAENQAHEDDFERALGIINDGGTLDSLPPELSARLSGPKLDLLERLSVGALQQTDWSAYDRYAAMQPEELRNVDLAIARLELAHNEYSRVEAWVRGARNARPSTQQPMGYIRSERDIINRGLSTLRIDRTSDRDYEERTRFEDNVERARAAFLADNGREPRDQELQQIVDTLVAPVVVNQSFLGGDSEGRLPLSAASATGYYKTAIDQAFGDADVDDSVRDEIYQIVIASYAARGITPNANQVRLGIEHIYQDGS